MLTPAAPARGPRSWMSENLNKGSMRAGLEVSLELGEIGGGGKAGAKGEVVPSPPRMNLLMTHLTHTVKGCPLHLKPHRKIHQKSLKYLKQNPHRLPLRMQWGVLIPPHCHGRNR